MDSEQKLKERELLFVMPMLLHRFLAENLSVANRTFLKKKKKR
jgi:hypothetical protein